MICLSLFTLLMIWLYWDLRRYRQKVLFAYLDPRNLPANFPKRSEFSYFVRSVCLVSSWMLLVLSFMQPTITKKEPIETKANVGERPKVDEIAFILDVSASMLAKDSSIGSSRFDRAKEMIQATIENLGGINISLMGFAGNAKVLVPDTLDYLFFRILLEATEINETQSAGTDLLTMVDTIKAKYAASPYHKSVLLVLLTDGEDTGFLDLDENSRQQAESTLLDHVSQTASQELVWNIVGLGNSAGSVIPNLTFQGRPVVSKCASKLLEKMAKAGRGHYFSELDVPLSAIEDNILAEVAVNKGEGVGALAEAENKESESSQMRLLLLASFLLLLAAMTLPEYDREHLP